MKTSFGTLQRIVVTLSRTIAKLSHDGIRCNAYDLKAQTKNNTRLKVAA